MARKNYLREPCLLARTTTIHLRTTKFRLLHFISLISFPLVSLSFSLPLSKMEDLPRGVIMNKGLNRRRCYFLPHLLLVPLSLHPYFHLALFMESCSHFLKDFHLLSFFSPPVCHVVVPCVFLKGSAICNGSCVTLT